MESIPARLEARKQMEKADIEEFRTKFNETFFPEPWREKTLKDLETFYSKPRNISITSEYLLVQGQEESSIEIDLRGNSISVNVKDITTEENMFCRQKDDTTYINRTQSETFFYSENEQKMVVERLTCNFDSNKILSTGTRSISEQIFNQLGMLKEGNSTKEEYQQRGDETVVIRKNIERTPNKEEIVSSTVRETMPLISLDDIVNETYLVMDRESSNVEEAESNIIPFRRR